MGLDDEEGEGRSGTWKVVLVILGIGLAVGALILIEQSRIRTRAESGPGSLLDARVAYLADGKPVLLLTLRVDHEDNEDGTDERLEVFNPRNGTRLGRKVLERKPLVADVGGAAAGRIWIWYPSDRNLELWSVPDLEPIARWPELVRAIPALAAGVHQIEADGAGAATITTSSGEELLIDCVNLKGRPIKRRAEVISVDDDLGGGRVTTDAVKNAGLLASAGALRPGTSSAEMTTDAARGMSEELRTRWRALPRLRSLDHSVGDMTTTSAVVEGITYTFEGSPLRKLSRTARGATTAEPLAASPGLISPAFLAGESGEPLALPEGEGLLVCHGESLDDSNRALRVSRITTDGALHFTRSTGGGSLKLVHLEDDTVVLAFAQDKSYVIALDWHDGGVRWRSTL